MILAVTGGKGGVGTSTVAYNLAAELEAVAVDADLAMADLPAGHGPDLHDVLAGRASPIEAVREDGPVAILPCGRTLAGARAADPSMLCEAVESVERRYGRVVIDCPAGMRADAGLALVAASVAVVVTRPSRPALACAVRSRELARRFDAGLVRVALNRSGTKTPTERIATLLGAPVVRVPESEPLARAQAVGVPVGTLAPESEAAERLSSLASAVQSCTA